MDLRRLFMPTLKGCHCDRKVISSLRDLDLDFALFYNSFIPSGLDCG